MRPHYEYVGMVSINGKVHRWSDQAKIAECGAGSLIPATLGELDISGRGRGDIGGLCVKCWTTLPKDLGRDTSKDDTTSFDVVCAVCGYVAKNRKCANPACANNLDIPEDKIRKMLAAQQRRERQLAEREMITRARQKAAEREALR